MKKFLKAISPAILLMLSLGGPAHTAVGDSVVDYINSGIAKYSKGDFDGAIADENKAIQLDPKNENAYAVRGGAEFGKHDLDGALADFNSTIQLDPKNEAAYSARGGVKYTKGDIDGAIADFDSAIQLNPKDVNAFAVRGSAKQKKGDLVGALADFNQEGLLLISSGDFSNAIARFNQVIQLDPKNQLAYSNLAWVLVLCPKASFRDGKKGVEIATKACELAEWKDPSPLSTLAAAYSEVGDFNNAVKLETLYMNTPDLSSSDTARAKVLLGGYQNQQPYPPGD